MLSGGASPARALAQRAPALWLSLSRVRPFQVRQGLGGVGAPSTYRRGWSVGPLGAFHQGPGDTVVDGVTRLGNVRVQQAVDGEWVILSDELRRRSAAARGVGGGGSRRGGAVVVYGRSFG